MGTDLWTDGVLYENYTGRWSRLIADKFIDWLEVKQVRFKSCIDMGCGTGALSEALLANGACASLTCLDRSLAYLSFAKQRILSSGVEFVQGDVQSTSLAASGYSLVVSGLVVNFVDSPAKMLREMLRLGRSGGVLGLYIWDFAEGMEPIRKFWDAAHKCNAPNVRKFDAGVRFPICQRDNLLRSITEAGWLEPKVAPVEIHARFKNFDDYWAPFLSGQGTGPAFAVGLTEEMREKVRKALMSLVTVSPDEPFTLRTRAWAAKGISP
jgi:ubiquinone/menaquinone biosynthesis C-methylase UbiE